jgi:hypothetical protein
VNGVQNLFIYRFFDFFTSNGQKRLNLYSNGQIHIQIIKFKFKQINQELTAHYHPPTPVPDGNAGGTTRALPPDPG